MHSCKITMVPWCQSPWAVVAALGHGLVLEEHPLCSSWAAAKYLKKQNYKDDFEAHLYSPGAGQPVNMCLSLMEEPLILLLGLCTPHTDRVPQPRMFPGSSAAKAPLVDQGKASVDLVVAQAWGWRLSRSGFISAAEKACKHPFSF